jgi:hypothetical protein
MMFKRWSIAKINLSLTINQMIVRLILFKKTSGFKEMYLRLSRNDQRFR